MKGMKMKATKAADLTTTDREMWDILHAIEQFERNGTEFKLDAGAKLPGEIPSGYPYEASEIIAKAYREELIDALIRIFRTWNALSALITYGHAMPLYRQHVAEARQSGGASLTFASWVRRFMTTALHTGDPHPDKVAERLADQALGALNAVGVEGLAEAEIANLRPSDNPSKTGENDRP
jgi:hypothetical protein